MPHTQTLSIDGRSLNMVRGGDRRNQIIWECFLVETK